MTGVEIVLFLAGCVFMVGSFFVAEKLSPSELSRIAELSEDELAKIISRGLDNAGVKIEDAIDDQLNASIDKVDRALEKETNEKIMAISEYSDTVLENINKTHNEIMFLYSMLNDKHTELTGMTADLQRLASDVRSMQENIKTLKAPAATPVQPPVREMPKAASAPVTQAQAMEARKLAAQEETPAEKRVVPVASAEEKEIRRKEILSMRKEGLSEIEIARKLKMGVGEVKLVIGLYRGE